MNKKIIIPIVLVVIILIIAGIFIITKKDNKLVTSPLPPQNSIVVTDPEVISLFDEVIADYMKLLHGDTGAFCPEVEIDGPKQEKTSGAKQKKEIYSVSFTCSDCARKGCYGPGCCDPKRVLFYKEGEEIIKVDNLLDQYDEMFEPLQNTTEMRLFLRFSGHLGSNELFSFSDARKRSRSFVDKKSDCETTSILGTLDKNFVVEQTDDGFIYQGYAAFAEASTVTYKKFHITNKGVMTELESEEVENCGVQILY
ncbi:hypothetical protein KJ641_02970 [Patescibacteria group bacterium]|nr:hypothetical protein [Patescibacteria group bacterium]